MKKFINNNKILLTNILLISLIIIPTFLIGPQYDKIKIYLKSMGSLGLVCSIINWLALQILLEKLSFLYTIDKIRNHLEPIKNFLIKDIFGAKNFDELKKEYKQVLTSDDKNKLEKHINDLSINHIIKAFNNSKTRENIKKNILNKIFEIEDAIKIKLINGIGNEEKEKSGKQFFKEEILPIIENKLEMSILVSTQSSIFETIKNYFSWLVLWGAYCGMIFGLIFKFIGYM